MRLIVSSRFARLKISRVDRPCASSDEQQNVFTKSHSSLDKLRMPYKPFIGDEIFTDQLIKLPSKIYVNLSVSEFFSLLSYFEDIFEVAIIVLPCII